MLRKISLITGGASGLGKGFAKSLLEAGGRVSILDIQGDVGLDTQTELNNKYGTGSVHFIKCDVRKQNELEDAFKKAHDIYGGLDLVVNNAGVFTGADQDWERTLDINLTAVMRCCFLATKYLSTANGGRGGHIVNVASTAGLTAIPFDPAYAASKHGVVGLTRCLALMLKSQAIRVNCLCPSFTDTDLMTRSLALNDPALNAAVKFIGMQGVDEVVKAFEKLLEDETATGGVMAVTPLGIDFKFKPKSLKLTKL